MFGGIGMQEMVIIGIIAVVLFGKRLPEVAKNLGGSYREFKKGLTDIQSKMNMESDTFRRRHCIHCGYAFDKGSS